MSVGWSSEVEVGSRRIRRRKSGDDEVDHAFFAATTMYNDAKDVLTSSHDERVV